MSFFNLDDFIAKATEALDKSAAEHEKRAAEAEALSDLINDPDIRHQVIDLTVHGTLLAATVGDRLKTIFSPEVSEEKEEQPTPEPEPEPTPDPGTFSFQDIFGAQDEAVNKLLDAILKTRGDRPDVRIFPDDEQRRGPSGLPFGL